MCEFVFFDSELSIKQLPVCRTDKIPLGTKGRTSILSVESSTVLRSFIPGQQKKTARPSMFRHFVPSRWLHPLATEEVRAENCSDFSHIFQSYGRIVHKFYGIV